MKFVYKNINKDKSGKMTLIPENNDDMWVTYNLIEKGDLLRASTIRNIEKKTICGTGGAKKRIRLTLTIKIESSMYDGHANEILVKGRVWEENEHVKKGLYHTINIVPNVKYTLIKSFWDSVAINLINERTGGYKETDVAVVMMHSGLAHICLITNRATIIRQKIEVAIPLKKKGFASIHENAIQKFIEQVTGAIMNHIKLDEVKYVIIATIGMLNDMLMKNIRGLATDCKYKVLQVNMKKFIHVHSSTGHMHSLKDVLLDPTVQKLTADTKPATETKSLDNFREMLFCNPGRAFYGVRHVEYAHEMNAIETLMITDSLFRNRDNNERRKFVKLVEEVKKNNGKVVIFSDCHCSGQELNDLSGIAAILRFPLEDPVDSDSEEDENEF